MYCSLRGITNIIRIFVPAGILSLLILSCTSGNDVVTDIDGNVYRTVTIGNQVWMAENLLVTHYRNGDPIDYIASNVQWSNTSAGAYCNYNNDTTHAKTYGRLYNWYAVNDPRNIAPEGWRIPTQEDWQMLVNYLGGDTIAGGKLKAINTGWLHPNNGATNESGFTALPGGYRYTPNGTFYTLGSNGYWWSAFTTIQLYSWTPRVFEDFANVNRESYYKTYGFSVRCIKENR